jgi:Arc/MetJ-type ribon-helix-helix transcriptional regulator
MVTRRKPQVNATLPPILVEKIDEGVNKKKYTSASEAVSVALSEHFVREEIRENEWKLYKIYEVLIEYPEGRAVLNEFKRTKEDKKDALIRAGIAHVEAGEYEEAKKCFAKAKELESGQPLEQNELEEEYRIKKIKKEDGKDEIERTKIYLK